MTAAVQFTAATFRDGALPMTLEDATRLTATYGGIHKFAFEDDINETFANLDDWTTDAGATATISSNRLSLTGGGDSGEWYRTVHDTTVPVGFVASFDWVSGDGGAFFFNRHSTGKCFIAWFSGSFVAFSAINAAGATTNHFVIMPYGISAPSRVQVAVRYSLDNVDDTRKWIHGAIFSDGVCYAAFAKDVGETSLDWEGDGVGFAAYESQNLIVDNFTISDVHRIVDWATIDIGRSPGSGMTRAIGSTRVRYMCRYDNTLKMWRPGNRDSDWTVGEGRAVREDTRDDTGATSHVRLQAAIHEADGFDEDGGMQRGHNFLLYNDPNITSEREAWLESYRVLHDAMERASVARFIIPPNYLLEPYDRITIDSDDWRVMSINTSISMTGSGPKIQQRIDAQKYEEQHLPKRRETNKYAYVNGTWKDFSDTLP